MSWAVVDIRRKGLQVIREEEFQRGVHVVTGAWNLEVEDCVEIIRGDERELSGPECDIGKALLMGTFRVGAK